MNTENISVDELKKLKQIVQSLKTPLKTLIIKGFIDTALETNTNLKFYTSPIISEFTGYIDIIVESKDFDCLIYYIFTTGNTDVEYFIQTVIDWNNDYIEFEVLSNEFENILRSCAKQKSYKVCYCCYADTYVAGRKEVRFQKLPENYVYHKIETRNSEVVNKLWPHNNKYSLKRIQNYIENGPSIAIETKNSIIAFELTSWYKSLGCLYVNPSHRRYKLGSFSTNYLMMEHFKKREDCFALVDFGNEISAKFHEMNGFDKVDKGVVMWFAILREE